MKKTNKIGLLVILALVCVILIPGRVQAGLQANRGGTSLDTKTASEFFELIRVMETGTLGKSAVGAVDNIDCHMAKNTEWGTAAMLGACTDFGAGASNIKNTTTLADNESTTGNKSGIYHMAGNKYEFTAHYLTGATQYVDNLMSAVNNGKGKYVDVYGGTATTDYIDGDALKIGNIRGTWSTTFPVLARGCESLFNVSGEGWDFNRQSHGGAAYSWQGSRAVVVNGSGL